MWRTLTSGNANEVKGGWSTSLPLAKHICGTCGCRCRSIVNCQVHSIVENGIQACGEATRRIACEDSFLERPCQGKRVREGYAAMQSQRNTKNTRRMQYAGVAGIAGKHDAKHIVLQLIDWQVKRINVLKELSPNLHLVQSLHQVAPQPAFQGQDGMDVYDLWCLNIMAWLSLSHQRLHSGDDSGWRWVPRLQLQMVLEQTLACHLTKTRRYLIAKDAKMM